MSDQFGSGNSGSGNSGGGGKFGGGGASGGWGDDDAGSAGGAQPDRGQPSGGQPSGGQPSGGQPSGGSGQPGGGGGGGQSGGGGGGQAGGGGGGGQPGGGGGGGQSGGGGGGQSGGGGGGAGGSGGASGGGAGGGEGAGGGGAAGGAGASGGFKGALGRGAARVANTVESLQIKDTGNAKVDAMGDVFNNALAPFFNAPPPEQGALGYVNQAIGAVMGIQNIGMELMNTGFAMATAGIAAMMPSLPAAFLTVPHIGMPHAHAHPPSLVPPAPPVPLPSIGTLMLAGSVGVLIMGMPAGRCGDLGLAVTCGSFSPAFDVFLGSSNTFIAGNRAARMGDMTRHCNPASAALAVSRGAALFSAAVGAIGVAADAVGGGPVMGAVAQIAADLAAAAMSALLGKDPGIPPSMGALMMGAPTVLIGGFPCPNLPNPLDALMHGLKCVGKAIAKSKGFGKLIKKVGLCNDPSEPISTFTGEVYNTLEDYVAPDSGFRWERHYRSGWNEQDGPCGYGFRHFYQRTLTLRRKRALYEAFDNELVALQKLDDGSYAPSDGYKLITHDARYYVLTTDRDETLLFERRDPTADTCRLVRYTSEELDVHCFYEPSGRLRALSEPRPTGPIDTYLVYDESGRLEQVLRGRRGQPPLCISRYAYADGCNVEWEDALGARTRMRYDDSRRMVQATDRRGYSFHWHYDPRTGRCIRSHGDDGLWAVEAKYEGTTATFTEPDGGVWTFKHYPDGQISHVVDPLGGVKFYEQDDTGRIVKQVTPGGIEYRWLYDENGAHYGRRDPWGNLLDKEDDEPVPPSPLGHDVPETPRGWLWGRPRLPTVQRRPPSVVEETLAQLEPPAATAFPAEKDALGRVVQRAFSDGTVERWVRDANGNVTAHQDANGNWTLTQFASWNLVATERTPLGSVTLYEHTHREALRALVDPNGNRTEYVRDQRHRIRDVRRHGGIHRSYVFDQADVLVEERDGQGNLLIAQEIGENGLPTKTTLASGEVYAFKYDQRGKRTEASSSKHRVELQHSVAGRLLDKRDDQGVAHAYDRTGKLLRSRYFDRFNVKYSRDRAGVLLIRTPDGSQHRVWSSGDGKLIRELGNGTTELSTFDGNDLLRTRLCWVDRDGRSEIVWVTHYRYGACHELLEIRDSEAGHTAFGYDADLRLQFQQDRTRRCDYRYDAAGNLTFAPEHFRIENGAGNLVRFSHREQFEYDERYRIAKRSQPHLGRETTYTYDSRSQLVEARFSDRSGVWRAAYDGLGRRIYREFAGKRTDFYWDGDRLAAEAQADGSFRVYVYSHIDALVPFAFIDYEQASAAPETGKIHYIFSAPNGMPLRVEDATRAIVWRASFIDAYGRVEVDPSSSKTLHLRFAGHLYDEDLNLFYNRYRDYDPGLARYLQPDPLGHAGSLNLYSYPANPLVEVDVLGLIHKKKPQNDSDGEGGESSNRKSKKEHGDDWGVDPETGKAIKNPKLTKAQKAEMKRRRDRYEAECKKADKKPMAEDEWREAGFRANSNRDSSHPRENQALGAVGAKPNNASAEEGGQQTHTHSEYRDQNGRVVRNEDGRPIRPKLDENGNPVPPHPANAVDKDGNPRVETVTTRPDGTRGNDVVEHKHLTGENDTLDDSQQMRAQREMAAEQGGKHEVVMTSDKPVGENGEPPVKPSRTVGQASDVKYVDDQGNVTHTWEGGRWVPVAGPP